jgi:glutamyl-tRNA reductase
MTKRPGRKLLIFDLAVPRDAEPSLANIPNVVLFNVGDLERAVMQRQGNIDFPEAQAIVASAAISSRKKLLDAQEIPGIATARNRLEEVCRQELDILRDELGPFTEDQEEVLARLASNITQRIASQLARELHAIPERAQREQLKATIDRLFRAEKPVEAEDKVVNR